MQNFAEAVINNLNEAIFLFNPDGFLVFVNKAGEEFSNKTTKNLIGRHYKDLFHRSSDIVLLIHKTLMEGRLFSCRELSSESDRNIDLYLAPFYSGNSMGGVIVCIRENLSLMQKEDDRQFDLLLFMLLSIAHEIKNPLSGIKGAAQLLKKSKITEDMREHIDLIIKETDRLNNVLHDYLQVSRPPVFSEINIHEVIEYALKVMSPAIAEKGVAVLKSYDPSLPDIRGDGSKLLQVFINLIKNSLESMDNSLGARKLLISTKSSTEYTVVYEQSALPAKKQRKQRWILISIEDTGRGISSEEAEKVFLPFYTRKDGGSGIGLTLSKKIIKDHGGTIKAKGDATKGAEFNIYLPY